MLNGKFLEQEKDGNLLKLLQAADHNDGKLKAEISFCLPAYDATVLGKILSDDLPGSEWAQETGGDEAVTALFMMAPDDPPIWGQTRNTLIYLSLAGERSLLEVLSEATATDSPFTPEEFALCFWAQNVLDTIITLKNSGLSNSEILTAAELKTFFN